MNAAKENDYGYVCPVRGCLKKHNRRFSAWGLAMHIVAMHGEEEFAKRMRAKKEGRS